MAQARCNIAIQDNAGNIIDGATITVTNEATSALAVPHSDRAGSVSLGNPFVAADGTNAGFYVAGGSYRIDAVKGAFSRTWRHEPVGTAAEFDFIALQTDYATKAEVQADNIPVIKVAIRIAGYSAYDDGGGADYVRAVSGQIQSADGAWWAISNSIIDPRMLGAKFNNSNDDGAAINSAIAIGRPVRCPPGIARSSIDIIIGITGHSFCGAARRSTEIKFTSAGAGMRITARGYVSDFLITSTIAAGSRTVAGLKVVAGFSNGQVDRVYSDGHLHGLWNQCGAMTFNEVVCEGNANHSQLHDGDVGNVNNTNCNDCAGNSSLAGSGFYVLGPTATGLWFRHPQAVANAGDGMSFDGPVNDVYITDEEISGNGGVGINTIDIGASYSFKVGGGLVEGVGIGIRLGNLLIGAIVVDNSITAETNSCVVNDAQGAIVNDNTFGGACVGGGCVNLQLHSLRAVINGNVAVNFGGAPANGIIVDSGAGAFTADSNDLTLTTNKLVGTPAAGSRVTNNKGLNPVGASAITVGASPFTYTAGYANETIYIRAGTVSSVATGGQTIFVATGCSVQLGPNESVVVTYSSVPTMIKSIH